MSLQVTNTLSGKKEEFVPLKGGEVRMYVCGPTVYNFIHIGNARPLVFFDVVRRYLELRGYKVTHIMNYTDVEDKIIDRARKENTTWDVIVDRYIHEYQTDMKLLKVKQPTEMPRVTGTIPEIVKHIEGLVANGTAYVVDDGEVFYAVRKFATYGKLSGKNIDDLMVGARVEANSVKRDPLDFSLWKPQKAADEPAWDSPWGKGRPGWHIECSAMAIKFLGESFDLHGGGMDLMHPHHENEIAQSEALTEKPYVKYWLHNNMLNMNSEKMSKSLGNILLTREFIEQFSAETLRFMLLSGHYRSVIDFSEKHRKESQTALHRVYTTMLKCEGLKEIEVHPKAQVSTEENKAAEQLANFETRWLEAMDDDFNTAKVMGIVFELVRAMNAYLDRKNFLPTGRTAEIANGFLASMQKLSTVINVFGEDSREFLALMRKIALVEKGLGQADIEQKIADRIEARKSKDFAKADAIRKELFDQGIELRDQGDKTDWDVIFA